MTPEQLEYFKNILEVQLTDLTRQADLAVMGIKQADYHYTDPVDQASFEEDQNMMLRIRSRETNLMRKIKSALERIEEGTFGYCDVCGEEIGVPRLTARPVAGKCIRCKSDEERFEKAAGL